MIKINVKTPIIPCPNVTGDGNSHNRLSGVKKRSSFKSEPIENVLQRPIQETAETPDIGVRLFDGSQLSRESQLPKQSSKRRSKSHKSELKSKLLV